MPNMIKTSILITMIILIFSACSSTEDIKTVEVEQNLSFMLPGEPIEFDPSLSNETYGSAIISHLFEPLVKVDKEGLIIPAAAESWTIDDNNKRFVFHLRKEAVWSDGKAVTAKDFHYALMRIISPDGISQNSGLLTPFILNAEAYTKGETPSTEVGIKVIDMYTLEIETSQATPFLLELISFSIFSPVRKDIVESYGDSWDKSPNSFVSNGPFFLSEYHHNDYAKITKNTLYWGADTIKLETIKFKFRKESDDILALYQSGEIDGLYEITIADLRRIPESEPESYTNIAPSTAYLVFDHKNPKFSDRRLREAISIAIDRRQIVDEALLGSGIPSNYLIPITYKVEGLPFHDFTEINQAPNLTRANMLIDDLQSEKILDDDPLTLLYMENGPDVETSKLIAKTLTENLGVVIEAKALPWSSLYDTALNGNYDLIMIGWSADYPHPMTFLSTFTDGAVGSTIIRWHDDAYDNELKLYLASETPKNSLESLKKAEALILDDYHIAPIYYRKGLCLMKSKVKGWYRNTSSQFIFTETWIDE